MSRLLAGVLVFIAAAGSVEGESAEKPLNVLMIAVDDLNGCLEEMHGELTVATPNLNA